MGEVLASRALVFRRNRMVFGLGAAISRRRRSDGEPLPNVLCALLVWPLMKVNSIHCFCSELCQILVGQVSVLHDFLGREDINWRGVASELAQGVYHGNDLGARSQRAFVVDDTSQARAGRKVEGASCYFDHTEGRHRKGQSDPRTLFRNGHAAFVRHVIRFSSSRTPLKN